MAGRFIHDGNAIDYIPAANTPAGTVVALGTTIVGITKLDIAANELGVLHLVGVYEFPASAAVTKNTVVKVAADGTVGSASGITFGTALNAATAAGSPVRVLLQQP